MGVRADSDFTQEWKRKERRYHHKHHEQKIPARNMSLTPENPQRILIDCVDLNQPLHLLLGDAPPAVTDGYGGWQEVSRPNDVGISDWTGVSNYKMDVSVVIDSEHVARLDPAGVLADLLLLARTPKEDEPPVIRVYGLAIQEDLNGDRWVIADLAMGPVLRAEDGTLRRQQVTLNLMEWVQPDDIERRRRKRHPGGKSKRYTVKRGDTLMTIAHHFYGDWHKWRRIADRNDIKNPRNLRVGRVLVIP